MEPGAALSVGSVEIEDLFGILDARLGTAMPEGCYEPAEQIALKLYLLSGDRVLDIGSGCGATGVVPAQIVGEDTVPCVGANPHLKTLIAHTCCISGFDLRIELGVALGASNGKAVVFNRAASYWASSRLKAARSPAMEIPAFLMADLLATRPANTLCIYFEGGEAGLMDPADLSGVDAVIIELHSEGCLSTKWAVFMLLTSRTECARICQVRSILALPFFVGTTRDRRCQ